MTKFKININEMQSLAKYKTFKDYLTNNSLDIISDQSNDTTIAPVKDLLK